MAKRAGRRYFGTVRRLPSGRFQARYSGPDGRRYEARTTVGRPLTFDTQGDADAYLATVHADILRKAWLPPALPKAPPVTFAEYAQSWMASQKLKPRTREHNEQLLRDHLSHFDKAAIGEIPPAAVRAWHAGLATKTGPTARAHAYSLLRTILNAAVADELIAANPCRVRGAGTAKRKKKIKPATLRELETIVMSMPERLRLMVLFASWCALRFGELAELRRKDVDAKNAVIHVRRGVTRTKGATHIDTPKSEAGIRDVAIPPHLMPMVRAHLREHAQVGQDGLLFPAQHGGNIAVSTLTRHYWAARKATGRPDLAFHELRHTGAVLAAATGATLAELMARLGHSTPGAAMRYQHAAQDRDKVIAAALSDLAAGKVLELPTATIE